LAAFTLALVIVGTFQWNAMAAQERSLRRSVIEARRASNRQSRDTRAAVKESEKSRLAADRPWLRIKISALRVKNAGNVLQVLVRVGIDNLGKSPALAVSFPWKIITDYSQVGAIQDEIDQARAGNATDSLGWTVFPNMPFETGATTGVGGFKTNDGGIVYPTALYT
jgi:hypothetical protein